MAEREDPHVVGNTLAADSRDGEGPDEPSVAITTRGRRFGRYLVLGTLGRGGMGVVVEAHDEQLDRTVAIKLLHLEATRRQETRLLREAQALARLSHPNVVQVYDIGTIGERTFIAMELVRGRTLAQWRRTPHSWRATVEVYLQAARGLAAAHAKGLVHRDFKPENCILGEGGRVRVVDFGLARQVDPAEGSRAATEEELEAAPSPTAGSGALRVRVTAQGMVVGTMAYMSLEQLRGEPADARSDQYSLCASLHEALHGVRPYEGRTPVAIVGAMLAGRRTPTPKRRLPRRLRRALDRGLSCDPSARWPDMDALVEELEATVDRRRWRSLAVALGVGVALGGGLALAGAQPPEPCREADLTLDGAWDEAPRRRLTLALARFGPADDEGLSRRITARLDEYARAWGEMARESCMATFVTRRQSEALFELRARCLERRRNRFASTVDALADAGDPAALLQGAILPFKLPELIPCADVEALSSWRVASAEAAMGAPARSERHAELRRRLDRAEALRESGRFGPALALAQATSDAAAELDDPPLEAEALECLGRIQAEGGSMRAARDTLEQAIVAANRAADDEVAARAWLSLLYAAALGGELAEAEHRAIGATAAVERTGDALLQAWLLNDLGILASEARDPETARGYLEQALELKAGTLGEHHLDVGIAWFNLGMMLSNAQQDAAAREPIARAAAIFEATVGPSHPLSAYAQSGMCSVELGLGDARAAAERCGRALERFESSAVSTVWESRVRFTMAKAQWELGRRAEAREQVERAARVVATDDPARARSLRTWLENHPS